MASAKPIIDTNSAFDEHFHQQQEFIHNSTSPVFSLSPPVNHSSINVAVTPMKKNVASLSGTAGKNKKNSKKDNKSGSSNKNTPVKSSSSEVSEKHDSSGSSSNGDTEDGNSSDSNSADNNEEKDAKNGENSATKKTAKPAKIPAPISDISKTIPVTGEKPRPDESVYPMDDKVLHAVFVILFEFDKSEEGMTVKQMCDHLLERHPDMSQLSTKLSNLISAKLNAYVKKVEKGEKTLTYCLSREWADTSPRRMVYIYRGLLASNYQDYVQEATKVLLQKQEEEKQRMIANGELPVSSSNTNIGKVGSSSSLSSSAGVSSSTNGSSTSVFKHSQSISYSSSTSNLHNPNSSSPYSNAGNSTLLDAQNSGQFARSLSVTYDSKDGSYPYGFANTEQNNSTIKNINRFSITYDPRFSSLPFTSSTTYINAGNESSSASLMNSSNSTSAESINNQLKRNLDGLSSMNLNSSNNKKNNKKTKPKTAKNGKHSVDSSDADHDDDDVDDDDDDDDDDHEYIYDTDVEGVMFKRPAMKQLSQQNTKVLKKANTSGTSLSDGAESKSHSNSVSYVATSNGQSDTASAEKYITAAAAAPRLTRHNFQNEVMNSPQVAAAIAAIQKAVITESPVLNERSYFSGSVNFNTNTKINNVRASVAAVPSPPLSATSSFSSSTSENSSLTPAVSKSSTPEPVCAQWLETVRAGFLSEEIVKPENVSLDELDGLFD